MGSFLYPVDTDQFQLIREQGLVYVDKTDLMFDLARRYRYVFLARPRRFGKSLLCNTFKAYFEGRKELFEGLKVMDLEKEWKAYPVLHLTMSGLKNCTMAEAKTKLETMIRGYESLYGRDPLSITPGDQLEVGAFNAPCERAKTPVPLLYQSGYLTIASYDKLLDSYTLRFPNNEVRQGMVYSLTNYLMDIPDWDRNATILEMARALILCPRTEGG